VHPLNSAGRFTEESADSPFVVSSSYLDSFPYESVAEKADLRMTFHSQHRSLERFARAFEAAGLLIEAIREPPATGSPPMSLGRRWSRVPLFLDLRAVKRT
jgi:hypothetical protein